MIAQASLISTFSTFNPHGNSSTVKIFDCLRHMDLFSHLQDRDLFKLTTMAHERRFEKDDVIVRQDDEAGKNLFVILEGEATVTWENADGFESLLATLHSGDMAGELELFDEGSRCTTLRAVSPVRLLSLHRDDLLRMMREKPELAFGFLSEMARRLGRSHRRMAGICNQRVPRRVACILVAMLDERGKRTKDSTGRNCTVLSERPTQRRIAELAGTARETVSRLFTGWESSGWFEDCKDDFKVFDEDQLRRLAGEGN